uniref:Uncharacterized protein n=1 Tax=Opuntia streptacantha TaxID=393608 RepID=A0A7C9E9P9_OPUST
MQFISTETCISLCIYLCIYSSLCLHTFSVKPCFSKVCILFSLLSWPVDVAILCSIMVALFLFGHCQNMWEFLPWPFQSGWRTAISLGSVPFEAYVLFAPLPAFGCFPWCFEPCYVSIMVREGQYGSFPLYSSKACFQTAYGLEFVVSLYKMLPAWPPRPWSFYFRGIGLQLNPYSGLGYGLLWPGAWCGYFLYCLLLPSGWTT